MNTDFDQANLIWILLCTGLVFLMQGGFLCLETGLTRSKNSINVAIKNITDFGLSVLVFWAAGYAIMFGFTNGGWFGTTQFLYTPERGEVESIAFFIFQAMFCGTAVTIISGAVAERVRFSGYLVIAAIVSGLIYPLFGHWAWGGGWLAELGFVDFAGSTVVHGVGGWAALAAVLIVGPRAGRFPKNGRPRPIQGHNLPMAMLGVLLLWVGWIGFNGGSTFAITGAVPLILLNTILAGAAGLAGALVLGWALRGRPDLGLALNGTLAGLVAVTAVCHAAPPMAAIGIGAVGGVIALGAETLFVRLRIDDAVGAVSVHAVAGVWGTLAVALVGTDLGTGLGFADQLAAQAIGITTCALLAFGVSYGLMRLANAVVPFRVDAEAERTGLNVAEHAVTTELHDLFRIMDAQARQADMDLRVPVDPFTEVGQIGAFYNRTMDSLQQATLHSQAVIRSADHAIVTYSRSRGKILSVNPAASKLFDRTQEELVGSPLSDIVTPEPGTSLEDIGDLMSRQKDRGHLDWTGKKPDETTVSLEAVVTPVGGRGADTVVAMLHDATRRRQLDRLKDEFVSTVSHELRTPLTSIHGALGLLHGGAAGDLPTKAQGMLGIAHKNSSRLVRLVSDILDAEKIASGKIRFDIKALRVRQVLENAVDVNRAFAEQGGVRLELAEPLPEGRVLADSDRVTQVLTNLLSNAVKFSPRESTVTVSAEQVGAWIRMSVRDQGPGIPPEFQDRIFGRFAQADGSSTRVQQGSGLGLNICKALVEKMGGKINFRTAQGKGTTFTFVLPSSDPAPAEEPASDQPRILVCEDDVDIAAILSEMIRGMGYVPDVALDAREAKRLLARKSHAAMTLDLNLPGQDGISLLKELREKPETSTLPVVVVSAYLEEGRAAVQGSAFGIVDWLEKPVDENRLRSAIARADSETPRKRVLHVEDMKNDSHVAGALAGVGAEITRAGSLKEARDRLVHEDFDLILLDLNLPDGEGADLVATMKACGKAQTPLIVLSGREISPETAREVTRQLGRSPMNGADLDLAIRSAVEPKSDIIKIGGMS